MPEKNTVQDNVSLAQENAALRSEVSVLKEELLVVHFEEDFCLIESKAVQQHLNMFRKAAINLIKLFKSRTETKIHVYNIMLDFLINPSYILRVIGQN